MSDEKKKHEVTIGNATFRLTTRGELIITMKWNGDNARLERTEIISQLDCGMSIQKDSFLDLMSLLQGAIRLKELTNDRP